MASPIYKCFTGRPTEAWYALAAEEQQALFAKIVEARQAAGVKSVITCDSSWASDHITFFGVEEFPNIEAVQQYHAELSKLNWFRYIDGQTVLGTKSE